LSDAVHFLVGLQDAFEVAQAPDVEAGQSASAKQAALLQFPNASQVDCVHLPDWGAQSDVRMHAWVSTEHVELLQSPSDEHFLPLAAQVPDASPPRQLLPSSQSTPTSLLVVNDPPGTPVSEPDVSRTISMFGLWICRLMISSGFMRASAGAGATMPRVAIIRTRPT
jgi:hypothetical protein